MKTLISMRNQTSAPAPRNGGMKIRLPKKRKSSALSLQLQAFSRFSIFILLMNNQLTQSQKKSTEKSGPSSGHPVEVDI
jgi:hypothetical protein